MLTRPTLKKHFHVEVVEGRGVYLLSETQRLLLEGAVYEQVVPLVDGCRTTAEIAAALDANLSAAEVMYALIQLQGRDFLVESTNHMPDASAAYWHAMGMDAPAAAERLGRTTIEVQTLGSVCRETCVSGLERSGLQVADEGDVVLVLVDSYLDPRLLERNRQALVDRRPWILAKPVGLVAWIGPLFIPGSTACWRCLEVRLRGNQPNEERVAQRGESVAPPRVHRAALPSMLDTALGMLATQLVTWIGGEAHEPLAGWITTYDCTLGALARHPAPPRPQCPACGDPEAYARQVMRPLTFASQDKTYVRDGGHRVVGPGTTVRRFGSLVGRMTGVVRDVTKIGLDDAAPVHVYAANYVGPASTSLARDWASEGRVGGKGKTDVQALASVLGEAIERASAVFQGDEPCIRSSFDALGDEAIHPNACMLFSEAQYDGRAEQQAFQLGFDAVPFRFDTSRVVDWTPVWSLTRGCHRYLPTSYLYFSYPEPRDQVASPSDSNGNSCGNTIEEAVLQGFLELVERDAACIWWYNRLRRPALDLDAINDAYVNEVRAYYRSIGREVWVLDITSDLGIPTFAAVSRRVSGSEEIMLGFGTHFDGAVALGRAVSELAQMIEWSDGVGRGEHYVGAQVRDWLVSATVESQPYVTPAPGPSAVLPDPAVRTDLRDDLLACQRVVEAAGLEMLVLNHTRPDFDVPVAKVVVPGLRHVWPRFARGRLYDVPVAMGWLAEPTTEADLNPMPMFV